MGSIRNIVLKTPGVRRAWLLASRGKRFLRHLAAFWKNPQDVPLGHYYSPIPSREELRIRREAVFPSGLEPPDEALNLNEEGQMALLESFREYYASMPLPEFPAEGRRYYFANSFYSYSDGVFLYCMLRWLRPKRIVEIGSGFSSALMLDVNDLCLEGKTHLTFIEPYPERLESLLKESDRRHSEVKIVARPVQDVDLGVFGALEAGDILFVDSSHIMKAGSDLHHILFRILPMLPPGVYCHFHDIFYNFQYPVEWFRWGRSYNEAYALRAFLSYNSRFDIVLFNTHMEKKCPEWFERHMPLCLKNTGGSLWLRKS
ncbi:MAG: class I SAM-dependent methyltransferase [Candidatus Omnitrophota bacterium]